MGELVHLGRRFLGEPENFAVANIEVADYNATNTSEIPEAHSSVVRCFADADGEEEGEEIATLVFHGVVLDERDAAVIALAIEEAFVEIERTRAGERLMDSFTK